MPHRMRAAFEVLAGIICVFGYLWLIYPLYNLWVKILGGIPIVLFLILSDFVKKTRVQDLGFRWDNWYNSARILLIFNTVTILVAYGLWKGFFPINSHFYADSNFWKSLFLYPFSALFQEYVFLAFFFRRYLDIFSPHTKIAIFFSACTFSLIHIPTPPLLIFSFVGGIIWAGMYHKYPNLYTIAISHAILGTFALSILLVYGSVGPDADIGRWSKKQSPVVWGSIDHINAIVPERKGQLIRISHGTKSIVVDGWVFTTDKIKDIQLSLRGKNYAVNYGAKRQDVAAHFNNPDNLYSGFNATIPISDLAPSYYPLLLKVYLQGELFYHTPCKKIWVNIQ